MSQKNNIIGNGSTIVKYILIMIATKTIALMAAQGYHLPINETQLAEIFGYILGFIIATIDAKYPNNIFNKIIDALTPQEDDEIQEDNSNIDDYESDENDKK